MLTHQWQYIKWHWGLALSPPGIGQRGGRAKCLQYNKIRNPAKQDLTTRTIFVSKTVHTYCNLLIFASQDCLDWMRPTEYTASSFVTLGLVTKMIIERKIVSSCKVIDLSICHSPLEYETTKDTGV